MGKRKKLGCSATDNVKSIKKHKFEDIESFTEINLKSVQLNTASQNKKVKTKNKKLAKDDDADKNKLTFIENVKAGEHKNVKSKKKNKGSVNTDDQETNDVTLEVDVSTAPSEPEPLEMFTTPSNKNDKFKKSHKIQPDKDQLENKKIKFTDDGLIEVNNQRKTNEVFSPEDDVKDEDIDKFCDEINEEDNAQYEDWVKLIEAKLNSNKKKPK